MEKQDKKNKDRSWVFPVVLIGFLIIFSAIMLPLIKKENQESYKFYKEWCPKLNATLLEPREGYSYNPRCIIEKDGIVRVFFISEINGEYKLREVFSKMSNRIFNLLWLTPTFSYGKRNIISVKRKCYAFPKSASPTSFNFDIQQNDALEVENE